MRPKSIAMFEAFYLLAILIEVARIAWQWAPLSPTERWSWVAQAAVSLLLVLLAARRRARSAAIVLAALFVVGLPYAGQAVISGGVTVSTVVTAVQVALQVVALLLLVRPESRAWFAVKTATPPG